MGQTHSSVADVIAGVDTTTTTPVPESTFLPVVHPSARGAICGLTRVLLS